MHNYHSNHPVAIGGWGLLYSGGHQQVNTHQLVHHQTCKAQLVGLGTCCCPKSSQCLFDVVLVIQQEVGVVKRRGRGEESVYSQ